MRISNEKIVCMEPTRAQSGIPTPTNIPFREQRSDENTPKISTLMLRAHR
jgi:hypothetical protein